MADRQGPAGGKAGRATSAFEVADRYVEELCRHFPLLATSLGVEGRVDEWDDFGLGGVEAAAEVHRAYRDEMAPFLDTDGFRDRLAAKVTTGLIDERLREIDHGDHLLDLRHMASSFQRIHSAFVVMPKETARDWEAITRRLETIDRPYDGYIDLLRHALGKGETVARRQVRSVIDQARHLAGDSSAFNSLVRQAGRHGSERLEGAATHARETSGRFADWLEQAYVPAAREEDGVGEERYRRAADRLVGMCVDPHDAYAWGWEELARLLGELGRVADQISPGADLLEVKEQLETDPSGTVESTDELISFVETVLTEAVRDLAGTHFGVPEQIRPLTVNIAPPGGPLGVSYMRPSEDLSRPGGVWYSIGEQKVFPLYQHRSTAYHEGFPGHHLQLATQMHQRDELSRVQRTLTWYPGHGEGWAMYAEVLMGELGYLADPRSYFGMLAKQMYRAVRIVVDIGLHLGLTVDDSSPIAPGEPWTFETAVEFMEVYGFRTRAQAEAEVLRYLGWPGQAIAYKLGERAILGLREDTRRRLGGEFDLKRFHATILDSGTMRLDLLGEVLGELL